MRVFTGEPLAKLKYTNTGSQTGFLGLMPHMPMAMVIPYDIGPTASLNCKRGAFMAGDESVQVRPKLLPARSALACCCGGMPPIIQHLTGSGTALLNAGGTVMMKQLGPNEKLMVDSHSVVAFTDGIGYDVRTVGTLVTACCGGEGCFLTELEGPGTVYVQTLSYEKLLNMLGGGGGGGKKGGGGGGAPPSVGMAR